MKIIVTILAAGGLCLASLTAYKFMTIEDRFTQVEGDIAAARPAPTPAGDEPATARDLAALAARMSGVEEAILNQRTTPAAPHRLRTRYR